VHVVRRLHGEREEKGAPRRDGARGGGGMEEGWTGASDGRGAGVAADRPARVNEYRPIVSARRARTGPKSLIYRRSRTPRLLFPDASARARSRSEANSCARGRT